MEASARIDAFIKAFAQIDTSMEASTNFMTASTNVQGGNYVVKVYFDVYGSPWTTFMKAT